jgi:hypothetical protein
MASAATRLKDLYGARALHGLVVLSALALAGYTVSVLGFSALWDPDVWWQSIVVWFLGAVVIHDLLLFPLYALGDRALRRGAGRPRASTDEATRVPALNYFRVPVLASGLLLLLFFPGVIEQGASSYVRATGQTQEPFLERWLLITGLLFLASGVLYVLRRVRTARRRAPDPAFMESPATEAGQGPADQRAP